MNPSLYACGHMWPHSFRFSESPRQTSSTTNRSVLDSLLSWWLTWDKILFHNNNNNDYYYCYYYKLILRHFKVKVIWIKNVTCSNRFRWHSSLTFHIKVISAFLSFNFRWTNLIFECLALFLDVQPIDRMKGFRHRTYQ